MIYAGWPLGYRGSAPACTQNSPHRGAFFMTKKNPSRLIPSNELTQTQRKSLGLPRTTEHVKQPNATPPRVYVNSTTKGHYSGADLTAQAVRRGADDHKQIKTRGIEGT